MTASTRSEGTARKHVVVTGGAGFLGSHLCSSLLDLGWTVTCIDNLCTGSRDNIEELFEREQFSFADKDVSVDCEVDGHVDAIMHLASPASPVDYLRMPIETLRVGSIGTLNALALAQAKGARLILASTSEVYGDPLVQPQAEAYWGNVNPIGPRGVYDEGKRFAEAACAAYRRAYGVDTAIARIFNTYGPRMRAADGRAIPAFIVAALAGNALTVHGDGQQTRAVCYVDDTVNGLLALLTSAHPGPINLGSARESTVLELAHRVLDAVGTDVGIEFGPRPIDDPSTRCPDISLAATVLDWRPTVSLDEGLRRTVDWFRSATG